MALIKCKECGKEISDDANKCVHCGKRHTPRRQKTAAILIGVLALTVWLIILIPLLTDNSDNVPVLAQGNSTSPQSVPITKSVVDEVVEIDGLRFNVIEVERSAGDSIFVPEEGKEFVGIKIRVTNLTDEEKSVAGLILFDGYADDEKCEQTLTTDFVPMLNGVLAAGKSMTGYISYEVPVNTEIISFHFTSFYATDLKEKFEIIIPR